MLLFDQEGQPPRRSIYGPAGPAAGDTSLILEDIARQIEGSQRKQSATLTHVVDRLRCVSSEMPALPADDASDGPWDRHTAEELMRGYEAATAPHTQGASTQSQADWIGERFDDVTRTIEKALAELRPTSTISLLEDRLETFQNEISTALKDIVRREDLGSLRVIEGHVNDLGGKLDELERHVTRIDTIESDLRNVMTQVSDERIAKLMDYDSRFSADLEAVARRTAEEVQSRLRDDNEQAENMARRHEELRALIEASIVDRREAEMQAASLVTGLSGRVSEQADRYDALKALLEQAIQEQRQNEQTALSMLDTLQQALVTVLDRMDALEHGSRDAGAPSGAAAQAPVPAPSLPADIDMPTGGGDGPAADHETGYAFRDTRYDMPTAKERAELAEASEAPSPSADAGSSLVEDAESPVDRLRRDFIADARRAKLKATANRAETLSEHSAAFADKPVIPADASFAFSQEPRASLGGSSGRMFGMSTKLLAAVLVLIIAINGGLLLLTRKADPGATPPIATEPAPTAGADVGSSGGDGERGMAGTSQTGDRSDAGSPATGGKLMTPYGFQDDVLDPTVDLSLDRSGAGDIPQGVTIAGAGDALSDMTVARVYEQQVLASLSGKLGSIAAGHSAEALLPEHSGRVDAAYTPPGLAEGTAAPQGEAALDLPPATVGPMSLRLAAAGGDASAEFEVAARLAEGKGTGQNYAEALVWYQRSAAKGFVQSQYRLGTLYERGLGTDKDLERAKVWYGRAAAGGNVKAMHNLAVLIAGGEQGEPDYGAAMPWFLKAAEHGLADSQYNLGVLSENGIGVKADRIGAYRWYALAARGGDADATARRDALKAELGAQDLAKAEALVEAFKAHPMSPLANDARTAGEDWKKRAQKDTST